MPENVSREGLVVFFAAFAAIAFGVLASWATFLACLVTRAPLVPNRGAPRVSWGGLAVLAAVGLWFALNILTAVVIQLSRLEPDADPTPLELMAGISVQNWILMFGFPLLLMGWTTRPRAELGLAAPRRAADALLGAACALFLAPVVFLIQLVAVQIWKPTEHPLQRMLLESNDPTVLVLAFVSAVILAPIAEEMLFRGIFQGWLERMANRKPSPVPAGPELLDPVETPTVPSPPGRAASAAALLIPAVLFAAVHGTQWPAPIPLVVLALGLGFLYRRTGGLIAPIAMHATFNGISTVLLIIAVHYQLFPKDLREAIPVESPEPAPSVPAAAPAGFGVLNLQ